MSAFQPFTMMTRWRNCYPADLGRRGETVANRRRLTVSTLIRRALEREVTEAATGDRIGPVEAPARQEIGAYGGQPSETRVAAALNLARRLDQDPTNGARTPANCVGCWTTSAAVASMTATPST